MARRPKHDPAESAREILDAAEDFLRDHAFRELTVDAVMSRTGLKRPAFYVHFRDRHDLTLRVVEDVAREVVEGIRAERFLILPHPEVAQYYERRASDPDRWLAGMRRLQARIVGALGEA